MKERTEVSLNECKDFSAYFACIVRGLSSKTNKTDYTFLVSVISFDNKSASKVEDGP